MLNDPFVRRSRSQSAGLVLVVAGLIVTAVCGCELLLLLLGGTPSNGTSQDLKVALQVRFVTVSDNFFEDIGIDFDLDIPGEPDGAAFGTNSLLDSTAALMTADTGGEDFGYTIVPRNIGMNQFLPIAVPAKDSAADLVKVFPALHDNTGMGADFDPNSPLPLIGFDELLPGQVLPNRFSPEFASFLGAVLDQAQSDALLAQIAADMEANIVATPQMTLVDNQRSIIVLRNEPANVNDVEIEFGNPAKAIDPNVSIVQGGIVLDVRPVVSADRRFVTLRLFPGTRAVIAPRLMTIDLDGEEAFIETPVVQLSTIQTMVSVPDGQTILIGGMKATPNGDVDRRLPVLRNLPYINRLFQNTGAVKDEQSLMILIKPTIIIEQEE